MLDVAWEPSTTGYCDGGVGGTSRSEVRKQAAGGTLKESDWYFRVCFFYERFRHYVPEGQA